MLNTIKLLRRLWFVQYLGYSVMHSVAPINSPYGTFLSLAQYDV